MIESGLLYYQMGDGVEAFSTMGDVCFPYSVITGHQVHGTRIALVRDCNTSREELEGYDALITDVPECAIGVRTADCIPVLLYDPVHKAVAAIHSGWKGTLNRISQKTIFKMQDVFGTKAEDLKAVIGPGICKKCFQVGEEVVNFFKGNGFAIDSIYSWDGPREEGSMNGGHHIDLIGANALLLGECGVPSEAIFLSGICTYEDDRFYSARRDGASCGRIVSSIKITGK